MPAGTHPPVDNDDFDEDIYVDANGSLTERVPLDGVDLIVHYDDIPETDITTVDGIRCTTPLRTVIDIAPDVDPAHLARMLQDCLDRKLFTVEEALERLAQDDMANRRGAELLRRALPA